MQSLGGGVVVVGFAEVKVVDEEDSDCVVAVDVVGGGLVPPGQP